MRRLASGIALVLPTLAAAPPAAAQNQGGFAPRAVGEIAGRAATGVRADFVFRVPVRIRNLAGRPHHVGVQCQVSFRRGVIGGNEVKIRLTPDNSFNGTIEVPVWAGRERDWRGNRTRTRFSDPAAAERWSCWLRFRDASGRNWGLCAPSIPTAECNPPWRRVRPGGRLHANGRL